MSGLPRGLDQRPTSCSPAFSRWSSSRAWSPAHRYMPWLTLGAFVHRRPRGWRCRGVRRCARAGRARFNSRDGRTVDAALASAFGVVGGLVGLVGVWLYWRAVSCIAARPRLARRDGVDYELLSPKMLGLALPHAVLLLDDRRAPWPISRCRSGILSVMLCASRSCALLALGLSRLARTATTQKVAHGLPRRRLGVRCPTPPSKMRAPRSRRA